MDTFETVLVGCGLVLVALATLLMFTHHQMAECLGLAGSNCQETKFSHVAGGKLVLLMSFMLFLTAALHGLFRHSSERQE